MSRPPRRTQNSTELDIVNAQVENSISHLTDAFKKKHAKNLSLIESTMAKATADAEVALTENGKTMSQGYEDYLSKINNIHKDFVSAKSKGEIKEINNTLKTYKNILKTTESMSKEEKTQLTNIVRETESAARVVRRQKLANSRLLLDALQNNMPDIAGLTMAFFGENPLTAFIGGAAGDWMRARKDLKEQEQAKQQDLWRDERQYNIERSIELRKNSKNAKDQHEDILQMDNDEYNVKKDNTITKISINDDTQKEILDTLVKIDENTDLIGSSSLVNENKSRRGRPKGSKDSYKRTRRSNATIQSDSMAGRDSIGEDLRVAVYGGFYKALTDFEEDNDTKENMMKILEVNDVIKDTMERQEDKDQLYKLTGKSRKYQDKANMLLIKQEKTQTIEKNTQKKWYQREAKSDSDILDQSIINTDIASDSMKILAQQQNLSERILKFNIWQRRFNVFKNIGEFISNNDKSNKYFRGLLTKGFKTYLGRSDKTANKWAENVMDVLRDPVIDRHKDLMNQLQESNVHLSSIETKGIGSSSGELLRIENTLKQIATKGITTIPFDYGTTTPKELRMLDTLDDIAQHNLEEFAAIEKLETSLLRTFQSGIVIDNETGKVINDGLESKLVPINTKMRDIMVDEHQDSLEASIMDKERRMEDIERKDDLQNSVDSIYNLLLGSTSLMGKGKDKDGGIFGDLFKGGAMKFLSDKLMPLMKKFGALLVGFVGPAIGVIGAALAGYAVGTLINKALGKMSEWITGGKYSGKGWLGDMLYDFFHQEKDTPKSIEPTENFSTARLAYPAQEIKRARTQDMVFDKEAIEEMKSHQTATNMASAVSHNTTSVGGSTTNISMPVPAHDTDYGTNFITNSMGGW